MGRRGLGACLAQSFAPARFAPPSIVPSGGGLFALLLLLGTHLGQVLDGLAEFDLHGWADVREVTMRACAPACEEANQSNRGHTTISANQSKIKNQNARHTFFPDHTPLSPHWSTIAPCWLLPRNGPTRWRRRISPPWAQCSRTCDGSVGLNVVFSMLRQAADVAFFSVSRFPFIQSWLLRFDVGEREKAACWGCLRGRATQGHKIVLGGLFCIQRHHVVAGHARRQVLS